MAGALGDLIWRTGETGIINKVCGKRECVVGRAPRFPIALVECVGTPRGGFA